MKTKVSGRIIPFAFDLAGLRRYRKICGFDYGKFDRFFAMDCK